MKLGSQWYERGRWAYKKDRDLVQSYAQWLRKIPWQYFCTLTFAGVTSEARAEEVFTCFIDALERHHRSDIAYLRGDERTVSDRRGLHYHVLLASNTRLIPSVIEHLWTRYAGRRSQGPGADILRYDPARSALAYSLKTLATPDPSWAFRNFDLFLGSGMANIKKRQRRRVRRQLERLQLSKSAVDAPNTSD